MKILNIVEQETFESSLMFNSVQRKQYFDFPSAIRQAAASLAEQNSRRIMAYRDPWMLKATLDENQTSLKKHME
jgi:hypothetical protein